MYRDEVKHSWTCFMYRADGVIETTTRSWGRLRDEEACFNHCVSWARQLDDLHGSSCGGPATRRGRRTGAMEKPKAKAGRRRDPAPSAIRQKVRKEAKRG